MGSRQRNRYSSSRRGTEELGRLALSVAAVFLAELVAMLALTHLVPELPELSVIFLDSLLLIAAVSPVLYLLFFRPLRQETDEHKRTVAELRESEQRLRHAQEIAHLGSWELDVVDNQLTWSDEVFRIFGLEPQEFRATYEAFLERVHPDDRAKVDAAYTDSLRENRDAYEIEHRVVRASSGEVRFVHEKCEHFRDATDRIIRSVGMVHDVTERKAAEAERERLLEEQVKARQRIEVLARREQRRAAELQAVLDNMVDAVFVVDQSRRLTLTNRAAARLFGLPSFAEIRDVPLEFPALLRLRHLDGQPTEPKEMATARALGGETVVNLEQVFHNPQLRQDRQIQVSAAPIRDEAGGVLGAVVVARDVTELGELDRLKDQFISVAAHELKTPVAIMKGHAQLLRRAATHHPSQYHRILEAIDRGANRLDHIVRDLLDISQLHLDRFVLRKESVDVALLVRGIVDRANAAAPRHRIRLLGDERGTVTGDPDRLAQAVRTLLDNAMRYSPEGGDVVVAVVVQNGEAVVSVTDEGIGIPREKQARIFERFYRAHTSTPYDYGGMGVGLYIARETVARHGGRMWFESDEGKGSTFSFSLPLATYVGMTLPSQESLT